MHSFPPLRCNLFPEKVDQNKDFWGFINIAEKDIAAWQEFLSDPDNSRINNQGEPEYSIPLVGWSKKTSEGDDGISLTEKSLGPKRRQPEGAVRRWR